jgi:hypothetical protein
MRLTPENYQIVEGHEPVASNALADTSSAVSLENANGVLILVHEDYAVDANSLVLTVHEGATKAEAEAGTYPLATKSEFQIWVNLTAESSDTWTKQTDAVTYTLNGAAGGNCMVAFYVSASCLTNGRKWVHLGAASGDAGNIVSVIYILDGGRYQQATPPTAIA